MSTASTASVGLLTSSRQQHPRGDDIGSLCRNASPSRKGAFSCSVVVSANAQHARFIATTIYRTYGIIVTSARLTSHSSGPLSFTPTSGAHPGPRGSRRCRRGGRRSFIDDALISLGSGTLLEYPTKSTRRRPGPPFDDENRRRGPARPPASSAPCAARPPTAVAPKRPPEATSA